MFDKYDINYLGHLFYQSGKKIYALETEYAGPLLVKVYMDPSLELDAEWFKSVVEKPEVTVPTNAGGTRTVALDYAFVDLE